VIEDGPQCPRNDESARKVTVNGGERVGGCRSLQEDARRGHKGHERRETPNPWNRNSQGEEYKDFGPNPSVMLSRIDTERFKCGQEDKNGGPPMPHGEWQVHEQLIADGLGGMILLDDVVDVADGRGNQKGKDESGDVMVVSPDGDEDGVEDGEEREPPGDSVDHNGLCMGRGELVDDGAKEEEVDDRPSEEGPIGWGEVRLLDVSVDGVRGGYGVDVRPQEEEVNYDVNDLEENPFFPLCRGHFCCPSICERERERSETGDMSQLVKWLGYILHRGGHGSTSSTRSPCAFKPQSGVMPPRLSN